MVYSRIALPDGNAVLLFEFSNGTHISREKKNVEEFVSIFHSKNGDIFLLGLSRLCTIRFAINYDKIKCCSIKKNNSHFSNKSMTKMYTIFMLGSNEFI